MFRIYSLVLTFVLFGLTPLADANVVRDAHTEAELVSEQSSVKPGESFWVGLRLKMDPKWHSYWQNPGDSGLATTIDWDLPEGISAGKIHWPYPEILKEPPLTTYGYSGEVLLLVEMKTGASLSLDRPLQLKAKANWLACEINCIPGSANLELELPVFDSQPQIDSKWRDLFKYTRDLIPKQNHTQQIQAFYTKKTLHFHFSNVSSLAAVSFFPYSSELIEHSGDQRLRKTSEGFKLVVPRSHLNQDSLASVTGIFVMSNGSKEVIEVNLPISELPSQIPFSKELLIFLFAFLGGLILNLMPCVLPVLSLKILQLTEEANQNRAVIFRDGLFLSLGVLTTFWILGGILVFLQTLGQQVGWGFQLQSPLFVAGLAVFFFILALNIWGVFEMGLSLTRLGSKAPQMSHGLSSFFNGVLITIVATPCSAPFMGSAIGFSLTQTKLVSFLVFTFLGAGMAFPYLLLSAFPKWVAWVPKPGAWMVTFKRIMAIPLFLTTLWLGWVLSLQTDSIVLGALCVGLVFIAIAFIQYGKKQRSSDQKTLSISQMIVFFVLGIGLVFGTLTFYEPKPKVAVDEEKGGILWKAYDQEDFEANLKQGRNIFIDFTAAWCLTCQANKRVALQNKKVIESFKRFNVITYKVDWTSRDEKVAKHLARYGRNSIPVYVLHGPKLPEQGVLLPEILTPKIVTDALAESFD